MTKFQAMWKIWPICKFKGLIAPGMAVSFDDSRKICLRKSDAFVMYLCLRRARNDPFGYGAHRIENAISRARKEHLFGIKRWRSTQGRAK